MSFSPVYNAALCKKEVLQKKQDVENKIKDDFDKRKRKSCGGCSAPDDRSTVHSKKINKNMVPTAGVL